MLTMLSNQSENSSLADVVPKRSNIQTRSFSSVSKGSQSRVETRSFPTDNSFSTRDEQAISPCDHAHLQIGSDKHAVTVGLRSQMVVSDSENVIKNKLPHSAFLSSSEQERTPDDVYVEKQAAREKELKTFKTKLHSDHSEFPSEMSSYEGGYGSDFISQRLGAGPEPASAVHTTEQKGNVLPVIIPSEEYPAEFKEPHFDCVLIYSSTESDTKMALNFKDIIQKHLILEDGRPPSVCVLDRCDNLTFIQSRFKHADVAMERSTFMFLFITKDFVNDSWAEMQKDECLMISLEDANRRWSVVPLHMKNKDELDFKYPYGLRSLKGIDVSAMLKGKDIRHVDPEKIKLSDLDPYFVQNLTKMFNSQLGLKRKRELEQENKLENWIREEEKRRLKKLIEEKTREQEHREQMRRDIKELEKKTSKYAVSDDVSDEFFRAVTVKTSPVSSTTPPLSCDQGNQRVVMMVHRNVRIDDHNTQYVNIPSSEAESTATVDNQAFLATDEVSSGQSIQQSLGCTEPKQVEA